MMASWLKRTGLVLLLSTIVLLFGMFLLTVVENRGIDLVLSR